MADAFITAEAVVQDWKERQSRSAAGSTTADQRFIGGAESRGWEGVRDRAEREKLDLRPVSWADWNKIDAAEKERGKRMGGKPREKIATVEEMLQLLH